MFYFKIVSCFLRLFHLFITGILQDLGTKLVFNSENALLRWLRFSRSQIIANTKMVLYYVTHCVFVTMNFVRRSVRLNFSAVGSRCCSGLIWIKLKLHQLLSLWNPSTNCHRNQFRSCRNETKHNHAMLSTLSIKKYKEEHRRYLGRAGLGDKFPSSTPPSILAKLCLWRW